MTEPPVLWQYSFSNYNEKVRWALDFKRIPHVRHSLFPGGPRALWLSRRGTVPVLDLDGQRIVDSTRIIATLERRWPDPPLYPSDEAARRDALELEDFFDEEAGHEVRRAVFHEIAEEHGDYVIDLLATDQPRFARPVLRATMGTVGWVWARRRYRIYQADVEQARRKMRVALDRIEKELQPSGYLVGDSFSVADLTAAALFYPLAWPEELQYSYPDPPPSELLESFADHPAISWIAGIYCRHRGTSAEVD